MNTKAFELHGPKSRSRLTDFIRYPSGRKDRPKPPHQIRASTKLYMSVSIDPSRVQPLLPSGLRVAASNTAIMSVYTCNDTPVGAYTGSIHGVVVEGHESPDGMEAVYWTGGYNDANGLTILKDYTADWVEGRGRIWQEGDLVHGETCRPDGSGALRFTMRRNAQPETLYDGAYHYLGRDERGFAKISSLIGYARHANAGVLEAVEIAADAPLGLAALKPNVLNWGVYFDEINMIMGVPRPVDISTDLMDADAARGTLLAVFDQHDQAALIVDDEGVIRFLNEAAERLAGGEIAAGSRLAVGTPREQSAIREALTSVLSGAMLAEAVAISGLGDEHPLIAQVSTIDPRLGGEKGALVLLVKPGSKQSKDRSDLLRLLGLTASEARLASLIGGGASPRDAAASLDITEGTARSTMKVIFDKLRVGKQSELARIVTKLEML